MVNKNKQQNKTNDKKITILFGYILFALTVVGVIISTIIPWTNMLFTPHVKYVNVVLTLVAFVVAAILPALISYIYGDRATHSKNKTTHHYNGVLFGVAAYWLAIFIVSFAAMVLRPNDGSLPMSYTILLVNGLPVLAILLIMLLVALSYARHQTKQDSVIHYRPYQVVLIGAFIGVLVSGLVSRYLSPENYTLDSLFIVVPIIMTAISYKVFGRLQPSRSTRLTAAVVAVGIAFIASTITGQLGSYVMYNMFVPIIIGLVVWIAYLWLAVRKV